MIVILAISKFQFSCYFPTAYTCGKLPQIENGIITKDTRCIGVIATIQCDASFYVIGSSLVHCEQNGQWKINGHCQHATDCEDVVRRDPNAPSGVYTIYTWKHAANLPETMQVYCEMTLFGGGWTVFQRRFNGNQDFYLDWAQYKSGFGTINGGEFWLGNDNIHRLTSSSIAADGQPARNRYSLLVALSESSNAVSESSFNYAYYDGFYIDDESNRYTLRFNKFVCDSGSSKCQCSSDISISFHLVHILVIFTSSWRSP